eukprot:5104866-Alexandrium_andersonii.AAC.1
MEGLPVRAGLFATLEVRGFDSLNPEGHQAYTALRLQPLGCLVVVNAPVRTVDHELPLDRPEVAVPEERHVSNVTLGQ